jgi:PAS domain S-box-containing protein
MLGYTIEELRGKTYKQITPRKWHKIEANIVKNQILANGFSEVYKKEYIRKDGSVLPVAVRVNTTKNRQGRPVIVWSFIRDITERKCAEQQLKTSLEEKEVLLREIHHRVKNNLQIIVSLLSLQSEYVQDKQAVELFRDSQFRVKSMALLHERLYETEDLAHINFSDYIRDLTNELLCSYGTDVRNIKLKINVKDVFPSVDVAVPCALIINELVTNCLKHAFPGDRAGEIRIEFDSDKQDNYTLLISDDGVGFAKDVDFPNGRTLGLQLVSTLAEQLQASVVLDKSAGTSFKISFSKPQ